MFDKLIESEPEGADFKHRRSYFVVSSLVVGVLFATAVVISIFAADIGLGNSNFELTEMLAPVEMAAVEPETPQPLPQTTSQSESPLPTRQAVVARIDETPIAPTTTSVVPNTQLSRPPGDFRLDLTDTNPVDPGTSGRDATSSGSTGIGLSTIQPVVESVEEPGPPPVVKPQPVRNPPTQSLGVINGRADSLPIPNYPPAAIAVHAKGKVDVQVLIDETGRVVSANAVNGHPLLRNAAEQAARKARFTPTYLSKVPVKVTGVISYNFTR